MNKEGIICNEPSQAHAVFARNWKYQFDFQDDGERLVPVVILTCKRRSSFKLIFASVRNGILVGTFRGARRLSRQLCDLSNIKRFLPVGVSVRQLIDLLREVDQ